MDGSLVAVSPLRPATYTNGFGDFIFGREEKQLLRMFHFQTKKLSVNNHMVIPVFQTSVLERTGAFGFFKLPLEIRRRIYTLLLGPLWSYNVDNDKWNIRIEYCPGRPGNYKQDWENGNHPPLCPPPPNRSFPYNLKCDTGACYAGGDENMFTASRKPSDESNTSSCHEVYLYWLRQMSNVNCLFRKELAQVFWGRTSIRLLDFRSTRRIFFYMEKLLLERPAICSGIKKLILHLSDNEESEMPGKAIDLDKFSHQFGSLSSLVHLEDLDLSISIHEIRVKALCTVEGKYKNLRVIRDLKVSNHFRLTMRIQAIFDAVRPDGYWGYNNRESRRRELENAYQPILRKRILPNSLRVTPLTEEQKYLKARAKEQ
ncbi:hypothetical protein GLAREA_02052 [Glarea lozoyensis ATCC 20868]|uniref:Uncharacterized protein n=1 Tax=Glarea lozoyensis (strain ATCC 20868 / MF5171) TaxID=1116229 RepID=S3CK42_GLAL2|nr:uncharacterized protein GLAREA_02052 [Glarea lozoyensis ATCC 20868]EPE26140.1 hypothetical protein GLAREA_02052 [Glarea lozoyensis ATCC 20868]